MSLQAPMRLDLAGCLAYVRGATLEGVREVYERGGTLEPVATLFYGADRVRIEPYESGPVLAWTAHLRALAARLGAVAAAVVVESEAGVLVVLEHAELARDVLWWAPLLRVAGRPGLGAWEQRQGGVGGAGPWSVVRAGGARGATA